MIEHHLRQLGCAVPATREGVGHRKGYIPFGTAPAHHIDLLVRVGIEAVERHYRHLREGVDVLDMLVEVVQPALHGGRVRRGQVPAGHSPMPLQCAHRRYQHHGSGVQTRRDALDVEELLGAQIESETSLGHRPVGVRQRHLRGQDRIATVRDVGKRPAMDQRRNAFQRLHQVRHHGVAQQRHHGAHCLEVGSRDQLAVIGHRRQHAREALAQILRTLGETQCCHDLRGRRDVEPGLARHALEPAAQPDDHMAQRAVVEIDDPPPEDTAGIDPQGVGMVDVVVDERAEQVVGR